MNLKIHYCPACGHSLEIPPTATSVRCPACGNTVTVERPAPKAAAAQFPDPVLHINAATASIPDGWETQCLNRQSAQSLSRPFTVEVRANAPDRSAVFFANTGETFRQIKAQPMARHIEGGFDPTSRTPMRKFQMPPQYLDTLAANLCAGMDPRAVETRPLAVPSMQNVQETRQKLIREAQQEMQRVQTGGFSIDLQNFFVGGIARAYTFTQKDGSTHTLLIGAELHGMEYGFGPMGGMGMMGGMMGMGGLFGGMLGMQRQQPAQQRSTNAPFGEAPVTTLYAYVDWESVGVYGLLAPGTPDESKWSLFESVTRSFEWNPNIGEIMKQQSRQVTDQMQYQQQQQFQAQQAAHRAQQAAFDSYNQAWQARSDAHHASFMAQSHARQEAYHPDYSEAIRGVNVYERPDGSEVEYSVSADRVFMKDGDPQTMRSASFGEDVPFGWTELNRK